MVNEGSAGNIFHGYPFFLVLHHGTPVNTHDGLNENQTESALVKNMEKKENSPCTEAYEFS